MEPKVHQAYQVHKVKEDLLEQMELTEPMELMERKVHLDLLGVVNPSNAYVVWQDNTPGNTEIFLTSSQSFGTPINLSNNTGQSFFPAIATSGNNNVYVAWFDNTPGDFDIFVITNAQPFGTPVNIGTNPGTSQSQQIAVS